MENPATWGPAEHIVDDVLANDDANRTRPPEERLVGASRAKQICDALRAAGLLADDALAAKVARVEALAGEMSAFNIEQRMDMVPRHVDVPDDYESGINDAGR